MARPESSGLLQNIGHEHDSLGTRTWLNEFRKLPQDDKERKNAVQNKEFSRRRNI